MTKCFGATMGSFDFASQTADIELFCSQHGTTLQYAENPREQSWLHMVTAGRDNMLMSHDHLMMQYAAQPADSKNFAILTISQ